MTYCPEHQHRCTIIRGKSQTEMENLLPVYLAMVHSQCPCPMDQFRDGCCRALSKVLFQTTEFNGMPEGNQKTVKNHFTEIAGTLLGLYYENDGIACESEICQKMIDSNNNTLLFKNLCFNFQFPNGMKKSNFIIEDLDKNISIKPFCFVISLLLIAQGQVGKSRLTKQEIGYYVLNNLDVLQGNVDCQTVYDRIMEDRRNGIIRPKLQGSHDWQHIKEQFNLLELTGMVECDSDCIWLNKNESKAIAIFARNATPTFNVSKFRRGEKIDDSLYSNWGQYYGSFNTEFESSLVTISPDVGEVEIVDATNQTVTRGSVGQTTVEIGDKGETLVYNLEKDRIAKYKNARFLNKVLLLGKVKGLGYDISSIEADENPAMPEFARFIEVKSTVRYTEPDFTNASWVATLNLSAKEWTSAQQFGEAYNIYVVYFVAKTNRVVVARIKNPFELLKQDKIEVFPTAYRMTYNSTVLEKRFEGAQN